MPKKRPPRTRLDVDERRSQLLELGLEMFGETNYDDIAIEDIAARASISTGLLYHYFGSKRGYYVATIRHAAAKLVAMIAQPDASLAPEERAQQGIANYLMFVEARANAYLALMRSGIGTDPEVLQILEDAREAIVRRILHDGMGLTSPTPLQRLALRGWVGSVEAVALDWLERRQVSRERVANLLRAGLVATVTGLAQGESNRR